MLLCLTRHLDNLFMATSEISLWIILTSGNLYALLHHHHHHLPASQPVRPPFSLSLRSTCSGLQGYLLVLNSEPPPLSIEPLDQYLHASKQPQIPVIPPHCSVNFFSYLQPFLFQLIVKKKKKKNGVSPDRQNYLKYEQFEGIHLVGLKKVNDLIWNHASWTQE